MIWGVTWNTRMLSISRYWTGGGPITRALTGPDCYFFGVGHRWRPDALPWIDLGMLLPYRACPPKVELGDPILAWERARLRAAVDAYEATKDLVGGGRHGEQPGSAPLYGPRPRAGSARAAQPARVALPEFVPRVVLGGLPG